MTASATRTGILIGAVLALTWIVLGFWPFFFVAIAMAIGALIGRIIEGKLNVASLLDVFRGEAFVLMTIAATTAAGAAQLGRTRITTKALSRVASAVTAEALGVDAGHVGVDLADSGGALALTVTTPIRVVSLGLVESDAAVVHRAGGSIVERTSRAQETIRDQVTALTGSRIDRVTIRVSGVNIQPEERVR